MEDTTERIITIDKLNSILFDDYSYYEFINEETKYLNEDKVEYVVPLNKYMQYLIRETNNVNGVIFDRINFINHKYNISYRYDYYEYLSHTEKIVVLSSIEAILNDEETYLKFIDFENNNEKFANIDISLYLSSLIDYMNYAEKSNLYLTNEAMQRFNNIMNKYSLEYKVSHNLKTIDLEEVMNPELEMNIINNIDASQDLLSIAYQLYVELNKRCSYNTRFLILDESKTDQESIGIYNQNINNITKQIVCNSWSKIYLYLLKKFGIKATIEGNYHRYVLFEIDGTLYKADGTNVIKNKDNEFRFNDILRCQLGLQVENFKVIDKYKNVDNKLEEEYLKKEKHTHRLSDKIYNLQEEYKTRFMKDNVSYLNLEEKLELISSTAKKSKLENIELITYINVIYTNLFNSKNNYDSKLYYIGINNEDNAIGSILIGIYINNEYEYYILENNTFYKYTQEEISDLLENKKIELLGHNKNIMGINWEMKI